MKLPDPLFTHVNSHMAPHSPWHYARLNPNWTNVDYANWLVARAQFPNAILLDQPGSGQEFLEFHRIMVRHFKWLTTHTPGNTFVFTPWTDFPPSVKTLFPPGFIATMTNEINARIASGQPLDALGGFIERTRLFILAGSDMHNMTHGFVSVLEASSPNSAGADMGEYTTAHNNEHFWGLHGWIDNIYADWQRNNNQVPDQSPLNPHDHMSTPPQFMPVPNTAHFEPSAKMRLLVRRLFLGIPPWPIDPLPSKQDLMPNIKVSTHPGKSSAR